MAVDTGKLEEFPGRLIAGLGTTVAAGSVVIGHWPGCTRRWPPGPVTAGGLAAGTGTRSPLHRRMAVRAASAGTSNMTWPRVPSR